MNEGDRKRRRLERNLRKQPAGTVPHLFITGQLVPSACDKCGQGKGARIHDRSKVMRFRGGNG
jgi:hypothetical protein